jgi:hypothetical protein
MPTTIVNSASQASDEVFSQVAQADDEELFDLIAGEAADDEFWA